MDAQTAKEVARLKKQNYTLEDIIKEGVKALSAPPAKKTESSS